MPAPLLEALGLSKSFGGVAALEDISISLEPETITGLIGPNGAGKTTLLNLLTGVYKPDRGSLSIGGTLLASGWEPFQLARRGIVRTFQTARVFPNLNVLDNVLVGAECLTGAGNWRRDLLALVPGRSPDRRRGSGRGVSEATKLLELFGLGDHAAEKATDLSSGSQKMVELARVLLARPKAILLDEPAAGLSQSEAGRLAEALVAIRGLGCSVLIVDHNLRLIMGICDRVVVMDAGQVIATGSPGEVQRDPAVRQAYLGRAAS